MKKERSILLRDVVDVDMSGKLLYCIRVDLADADVFDEMVFVREVSSRGDHSDDICYICLLNGLTFLASDRQGSPQCATKESDSVPIAPSYLSPQCASLPIRSNTEYAVQVDAVTPVVVYINSVDK